MAKLTFSRRGGKRYRLKISSRSSGQAAASGLRHFSGLAGVARPQLQAAANRPRRPLTTLVLTHAHLDHTGWLPVLVKSGYRGPIFANPATIELTTILLKDSAHLQQEDTLHARIHKDSRHAHPEPLLQPRRMFDPTLKLIKSMPRSGSFDISPEFRVSSYDAGHILGSSSLELTIAEGGKKTIVIFSGDIRAIQPSNSEGSDHAPIESGCADLRINLRRPRTS